MPRCVVHRDLVFAEPQDLPWLVEAVDPGLRLDAKAEHHPLLHDGLVEKVVGLVQPDRNLQDLFRTRDASHVVQVRVCQKDGVHVQRMPLDCRQQQVHVVTRVDDDPLPCRLTAENEAILHERRYRTGLQDH